MIDDSPGLLIYIESNFILEIAFAQQQAHHCNELLNLAANGQMGLCIPAFSLIEARETVERYTVNQQNIQELTNKLLYDKIKNSTMKNQYNSAFERFTNISVNIKESLQDVLNRLVDVATILDFNQTIVRSSLLEKTLKFPDAIIYHSIKNDLQTRPLDIKKILINKNAKDFIANQYIYESLQSYCCEVYDKFSIIERWKPKASPEI